QKGDTHTGRLLWFGANSLLSRSGTRWCVCVCVCPIVCVCVREREREESVYTAHSMRASTYMSPVVCVCVCVCLCVCVFQVPGSTAVRSSCRLRFCLHGNHPSSTPNSQKLFTAN